MAKKRAPKLREMAPVERRARLAELARMWGDPANGEVYDPLPQQRVPAAGAWVMITRKLPPLERGLDREIRVGRVFYVLRCDNADDEGFLPDGTFKVLLHGPDGDVWLWPYEYATIDTDRLIALWRAGELIFHPANLDDATFNGIVYYARSRGIPLTDAAVMALGTLNGAGLGWFEPRADLAAECEAMAEQVHNHPIQRRRRWA